MPQVNTHSIFHPKIKWLWAENIKFNPSLVPFYVGSLMVITLKVISCAINYNDGLLKEEDLRESQRKNRLLKLPNLIEYIGYCLCCGSHFAGPVYEVKDYLDWTERKGVKS